MKDAQLNTEAINAPALIHKGRKVRPARWAWKLGGLEFSRIELVQTWRRFNEHAEPVKVFFHEGHGCSCSPYFGKKEGRHVRTLRELLTVARIDYINPNTRREVIAEAKP